MLIPVTIFFNKLSLLSFLAGFFLTKTQSIKKLLVILAVFLFVVLRYSVIILQDVEKTKVVFNHFMGRGK